MSEYILNIPFQLNVRLAISIMLIAATVIPLVAWLGLRGFLNVPARQLLNSI
jgi:putative ABC transport system permease protein